MKTHTILIGFFLTLSAAASAQVKDIQINAKVVSVPLDPAALRDAGLTLDSTAAVSKLGVIPAEKVAEVLAKLEKMPGHTLLNAPSVTTKSGTRTTSESTREFIYPTEFVPPRFSPAAGDKPVTLTPGQAVTAIPSTPDRFQMRMTGFRLEIEPVIGPDGNTLDLNLAPELVTFEGFINYGCPIKAAALDKDGKLQEVVLTENQVLQPVFSTMKSATGVTMPSGHVLVLGGASSGTLPSATTKPDLKQEAKLDGKPTHAVFFFIQAKVFTP